MDANRSSSGSGNGSGEECSGNANGGGAEYKELDVDGAVVELEHCETVDQDSSVVFVS